MRNLLFISFLILLISCEEEKITPKSQSIYPLKIGNEWTYQYSAYNNDELLGEAVAKLRIDTIMYLSVEGEEKQVYRQIGIILDEKEVGYVNIVDSSFYYFGRDFVSIEDEKIRYAGGDSIETFNQLFAKYPIEKGEQWDTYTINYNYRSERNDTIFLEPIKDYYTVKCLGTDISITIKNKNYSCIGYKYYTYNLDTNYYDERYYSLGIGLVEERFYSGDYFSKMSLTNYSLK